MNWFQRHLNWTWVLNLIAIYPTDFLIIFILLSINSTNENFGTAIMISIYILNTAWLLGISTWVLIRKARSLGHLLWLIVPFGVFVFLALENKSYRVKDNDKEGSKGKVRKYSTYSPIDAGKISWFCTECDAELEDDARFCPKCGVEFA